MAIQLVVINEFGVYKKGDVITDGSTITNILASPNQYDVTKRNDDGTSQTQDPYLPVGAEKAITTSRNLQSSDQANILVNAGTTDLTITILTEAVSGIKAGAVQRFFTSSTGKFIFAGIAVTGTAPTQVANTGFELRYRGGDVWVWDGVGGNSVATATNNPATFIYTDGVLTSSTDTTTGEVTNFIYTNGVLTSLTVTLGASVKTQTFTYTNGVLTAVSALV